MQIARYKNIAELRFMGFVNVHLIDEGDCLTLIDTGLKGCAKHIAKFSQDRGLKITKILLTHAHIDHIGGLDEITQFYPEARVYISKRDNLFMKGDMRLLSGEPLSKLRGGFIQPKQQADFVFEDGEKIGSLRAIGSPGHTPGHMSFFHEETKSLFAGDAFSAKSGISTAGTLKILFPFTAMATWEKNIALKSAEKLKALAPEVLFMGHGKYIQEPFELMKFAIHSAQRKLHK